MEVSNPSEDVEAVTEGACYMVTDVMAPEMRRSPLLLRTTKRTLWDLIPPQQAQSQ